MSNDFSYNDELLLTEQDRAKFRREHPDLAFAFINDDIAKTFPGFNSKAEQAKKNFRVLGLLTIGSALIALILAIIEPLFLVPAEESGQVPAELVLVIAIFAAVGGIGSFAVGWFGMGLGRRKEYWLRERFRSERIRQWHWQYILTNIEEISLISKQGEKQRQAYIESRAGAYEDFLARLETNLGMLLNEQVNVEVERDEKVWIVFGAKSLDGRAIVNRAKKVGIEDRLLEVCRAYRELRFLAQREYTTWMLDNGSFWLHPKTQIHKLHSFSHLLVIAIALLHAAVITGVFLEVKELKGPVVYALIIASALLALALRAVGDGLRPVEQATRLGAYLRDIYSITDDFENTSSVLKKIESMRQLEISAVLEMQGFIQSVKMAKYIL